MIGQLRAPLAVVSCLSVVDDDSQSPCLTVPTIRLRQLPPRASEQQQTHVGVTAAQQTQTLLLFLPLVSRALPEHARVEHQLRQQCAQQDCRSQPANALGSTTTVIQHCFHALAADVTVIDCAKIKIHTQQATSSPCLQGLRHSPRHIYTQLPDSCHT